VNAASRFARQRLAARSQGGDLTLEEFWRSYEPSWRERWQDMVEVLYRSAGLWYGEGRRIKAISYGLLALLANPAYTIPRLYQQRRGKP
jgi:hypothetical protein